MAEDVESQEYFALLGTIAATEQRLLTIKGWGVTLSLAALGLGFQYRAYGHFLVAVVSSAAFWVLEAAVKRHQMRYYPRMREIEHRRAVAAQQEGRTTSAPRIDWSWETADALFRRGVERAAVQPRGRSRAYGLIWLAAHVCLPHVLTLVTGAVLLALALGGNLPGFEAAGGRGG